MRLSPGMRGPLPSRSPDLFFVLRWWPGRPLLSAPPITPPLRPLLSPSLLHFFPARATSQWTPHKVARSQLAANAHGLFKVIRPPQGGHIQGEDLPASETVWIISTNHPQPDPASGQLSSPQPFRFPTPSAPFLPSCLRPLGSSPTRTPRPAPPLASRRAGGPSGPGRLFWRADPTRWRRAARRPYPLFSALSLALFRRRAFALPSLNSGKVLLLSCFLCSPPRPSTQRAMDAGGMGPPCIVRRRWRARVTLASPLMVTSLVVVPCGGDDLVSPRKRKRGKREGFR